MAMTDEEMLNVLKAYELHQYHYQAWEALNKIVELKYEGWELVKDVTYPIGKKDIPEFYFKMGQLFAKDQVMQVIAKELQ